MTPTLVGIGLWVVLLWAIGTVRGSAHHGLVAKAFLLPGLALDAAVRLVACLVSGTPARGHPPWRRGQPLVEVGRSPIAHVGAPLYMGVRLALTFVGTVIVLNYFPSTIERSVDLDHDRPLLTNLASAATQFGRNLAELPRQLQADHWHGAVLLYGASTYLIALGFSVREFVSAAWALTALVIVALIAEWVGLGLGFLSRGQWIDFFYGDDLWSALSLLVELSCVTLCALILIRAVFSGVKNSRARSARKTR